MALVLKFCDQLLYASWRLHIMSFLNGCLWSYKPLALLISDQTFLRSAKLLIIQLTFLLCISRSFWCPQFHHHTAAPHSCPRFQVLLDSCSRKTPMYSFESLQSLIERASVKRQIIHYSFSLLFQGAETQGCIAYKGSGTMPTLAKSQPIREWDAPVSHYGKFSGCSCTENLEISAVGKTFLPMFVRL